MFIEILSEQEYSKPTLNTSGASIVFHLGTSKIGLSFLNNIQGLDNNMRLSKILLIITILLIYNSVSASNIKDSKVWYSIYVNGRKAGYVWDKITNIKYHEKKAYLYECCSYTSMNVGLSNKSMLFQTKEYLDSQYRPLEQTGELEIANTSSNKTSTYSICYKDKYIECKKTKDGKTDANKIPISPKTDLSPYFKLGVGVKGFKQGNIYEVYAVDTDSMQLIKKKVKIINATAIDNGKRLYYDKVDVCDDGRIVKRAYDIIPTNREDSLRGVGFHGAYLENDSIPANKDLPEDKEIWELKVSFEKINTAKYKWISDTRQTVNQSDDGRFIDFKISTIPFEENKSNTIPVKDITLNKYLSESNGIEVKNSEIAVLAREIVGAETNTYKAATLIWKWVLENANEYENRDRKSALRTLHNKKGNCVDYAVLYTALARAVGIPTKLVSGFVYVKGMFCCHSWVEIYAGIWVPIDPLNDNLFVDASYIKQDESSDKSVVESGFLLDVFNAKANISAYTAVIRDPIKSKEILNPSIPAPGPEYTWIIAYADWLKGFAAFWHKDGNPLEISVP